MQQKIALKYTQAVYLPSTSDAHHNNGNIAATLCAEMIQLGYIPTQQLLSEISTLPQNISVSIYSNVISALREMKGADVKYVPFYPNFPLQMMNMDEAELLINAIIHYWTAGIWRPEVVTLPRKVDFEDVTFKEIGIIHKEEFKKIFQRLVTSNDSLSGFDKDALEYFLTNEQIQINYDIPYKETMCIVAGRLLTQQIDIRGFVKNTTDILRIATYLSNGDISLSTNTKFKSLPRRIRKLLVALLQDVIDEEDINRHRNKWIKLFHSLHVGEYSTKVNRIAAKVRNNKKIETFNGKVQCNIDAKDIHGAVDLLVQRPSEFARRLDHLYRTRGNKNESNKYISDHFTSVASSVPTRILVQVGGALRTRVSTTTQRVVFPKGNVQRGIVLNQVLPALPRSHVNTVINKIHGVMKDRFKKLDDLGTVYIDPALKNCPVPTQMRSMSAGTCAVARGTRLPIGTDSTLRFFIYWIGQDIDLSATMYDDELNNIGHVSYNQLTSAKFKSYHSGDITHAPNGASEFIDIDIDEAYAAGARYIGMHVLVYSGPSFKEHKKVYAGWMTRSHPASNEIYDAKTVQQKIDLNGESTSCIPVLFDLKYRKAIWADISTGSNDTFGRNNVESNRASIVETMRAIIDTSRKMSLYELFHLHASVRGILVDIPEDADIVFSASAGDVTPFDITTINSEYVV